MNTTDKITIHTAMWNLPGCLPEMEPFRTLTEVDAREFLADALETASEELENAQESQAATHYAAAIRASASDSCTVAGYVYTLTSDEPIDDEECRRAALAMHLGCPLDDVQAAAYGENSFDAEGGEYRVLDDEESDKACAEDIAESLWAFNSDFLAGFVVDGINAPELDAIKGDRCEDANGAMLALVNAGSGMERLVEDAIGADGRGHFLSPYDGAEHDSERGGFYIYQTN